MTREEVGKMAEFVARQIHAQVDEDAGWDDLTDDERNDFLQVAYAAMGAHDAWLNMNSYRIVKLKAATGPTLITPPKPKLVGLN